MYEWGSNENENISNELMSFNKAMTIILKQLSILISHQIDHLYLFEISKYNKQQLIKWMNWKMKSLKIILHIQSKSQIKCDKNSI